MIRRPAIQCGLVAATAGGAFLPSLAHGLVWDDPMLLALVAARIEGGGIAALLKSEFLLGPGSPHTGYYRPVVLLSLLADGALGGGAPWLYHLENLILHAACAGLVFLAARFLLAPRAALLSGFLFALNPVHVEAVSFCSGRTDLWAAVFLMGSTLFWLRGRQGPGRLRSGVFLSGLCLLLACLSKEVAFVLPGVLLFWEAMEPGCGSSSRMWAASYWRRSAPWAASWAAAVGISLFLRMNVAHVGLRGSPSGMLPEQAGAGTQAVLLRTVGYFKLISLPWPLNGFYTPASIRPLGLWVAGAALGLGLLIAAGFILPGRQGWKAGVWTALFLAPVMGFFPISGPLLAERFLYVPSIGASLAMAGLIHGAGQRAGSKALAGFCSILLLGFALATVAGQGPWRSEETLYPWIIRRSPQAFVAHLNYGNTLAAKHRWEEAAGEFRQATQIVPYRSDAWNNLGVMLENLGRPRDAIEAYRGAVRCEIPCPQASENLGWSLMRQGEQGEAEKWLREAVRRNPSSSRAREGLAGILERSGNFAGAASALGAPAGHPPADSRDSLRMAGLLRKSGQREKALEVLEHDPASQTADVQILMEIASIQAELGRLAQAEDTFRRATLCRPERPEAFAGLGFVLHMRGRFPSSEEALRTALRLDPNHAMARFYLGRSLIAQGRREEALAEAARLRQLDPKMAAALRSEAGFP